MHMYARVVSSAAALSMFRGQSGQASCGCQSASVRSLHAISRQLLMLRCWVRASTAHPFHKLALKQVNLYDRLGLDTIKKFSTHFYTSFYNDKPYYE